MLVKSNYYPALHGSAIFIQVYFICIIMRNFTYEMIFYRDVGKGVGRRAVELQNSFIHSQSPIGGILSTVVSGISMVSRVKGSPRPSSYSLGCAWIIYQSVRTNYFILIVENYVSIHGNKSRLTVLRLVRNTCSTGTYLPISFDA